MTNPTPGPWEATKLLADGFVIKREGYEIRTPAWDVATWIERGAPIRKEADARLIAAAPDLLAACEFARSHLNKGYRSTRERIDAENEMLTMFDTAIAKARGE